MREERIKGKTPWVPLLLWSQEMRELTEQIDLFPLSYEGSWGEY